jgi:hypothetical protein
MSTDIADKLDLLIGKMSDISGRVHELSARADSFDRRDAESEETKMLRHARMEHVRSQADSTECRNFQARADAVLGAFGEQAPQPAAGEEPRSYRMRLAKLVQRKLPVDTEMARLRLGAVVDPTMLDYFEGRVFADAQREAVDPSFDNLPADGSLISRETIDPENGFKCRKYFGRETFVHAMKPIAQAVVKFNLPERMV